MGDSLKKLWARGFALLERGDYRAAEQDLTTVASHTDSWEALLAVAYARQKLGEDERASEAVERAIDRARAFARARAPEEADIIATHLCGALQPLLPTLGVKAADATFRACGALSLATPAKQSEASAVPEAAASPPTLVLMEPCTLATERGQRCLTGAAASGGGVRGSATAGVQTSRNRIL
eukprot:1245122-Prymnesium_polylepis.1